MLTAFTARPIVELKSRDKSRIESLVAYGDRLLVGLHTGVLRIYRVNEPPAQAPDPSNIKPTDLLREVEKFAPRAIEQLAIIKEANTLVSLANYAVSLHDLQTFAPLSGASPLPGTKSATCFAVTSNIVKDPTTNIPEIVSRLAVAVKRRLLLWNWYASELSNGSQDGSRADGMLSAGASAQRPPPEILLPETIRSLTWASATKLLVGMNAGYSLVDVVSHTVENIAEGASGVAGSNVGGSNGSDSVSAASRLGAFGSASMGYMGLGSYMPKPLAAKLANGEVLLARDMQTVFITDEGKPLDKRPIPWVAAPESIGYSYPYILALQPPSKGSLEVRSPATLSLVQTIPLPSATQLHVSPPSVSLAHAGKGFHVSSDRGIWKMDATSYDSQVDELVSKGHLDEAISLLGLLEDALLRDKPEMIRAIKMQKAEQLFRQKRYLESMDLFSEEDVHAPPERVLRFFPQSIVGSLSDEVALPAVATLDAATETASLEEDTDGKSHDPIDPDELSPQVTSASESLSKEPPGVVVKKHEHRPPTGDAASSPPKAGGFTKMFLGGSRKAATDTATSAPSPSKAGRADGEAASIKGKPAPDQATSASASHDKYVALEGKDLLRAVEALNSYLAGTRARLQRVIDPATGKLKPRKAQLPVHIAGRGASDGGVADKRPSGGGDADGEDDQELERQLRATFTLVDTTMFRVLMLIRPKLASSLFRIPNFCDPDVVNERLLEHNRYNELVNFFYGKKLHRPALELLRRFGQKNRSDSDSDGDGDGEDDGRDAAVDPALLGPRRTIAYLQSLPSDMIDLILEFSEWTLRADPVLAMNVFVADSENAEMLPRDRVVRFLASIDPELEIQYLEHITGELNDLTPDFHNTLIEQSIMLLKRDRHFHDASSGDKKSKWFAAMAKLVQFLKDSRQYSLSQAFGLIPRDDPLFYEAQAIVLSNMGQHKQALEIYVFKMKDFDKAENYCYRIHQSQEKQEKMQAASTMPSPRIANRPRLISSSKTPIRNSVNDSDTEDNQPPSIYHTLLTLYLAPPPPYAPQPVPALALLSRHGSRLPATSTLQLIPDGLPIANLESYFQGRMRSANSIVNQSHIEKGLRQTAVLAAQASLLLGNEGIGGAGSGAGGGRNRRVVVNEERVCGVCHKRLGGSVVAVLPDNAVVHYGCLNRAGRVDSGRASTWGR